MGRSRTRPVVCGLFDGSQVRLLANPPMPDRGDGLRNPGFPPTQRPFVYGSPLRPSILEFTSSNTLETYSDRQTTNFRCPPQRAGAGLRGRPLRAFGRPIRLLSLYLVNILDRCCGFFWRGVSRNRLRHCWPCWELRCPWGRREERLDCK